MADASPAVERFDDLEVDDGLVGTTVLTTGGVHVFSEVFRTVELRALLKTKPKLEDGRSGDTGLDAGKLCVLFAGTFKRFSRALRRKFEGAS